MSLATAKRRFAVPAETAVICRTLGGGPEPYIVAQARRGVLRFCRLTHHGDAVLIRAEWDAGNYTIVPGELRRFPMPALPAKPVEVFA